MSGDYVDLLAHLTEEKARRFQALDRDEKGAIRALAEMLRDLDSEIRGAEAIGRELRGMSFKKRNRAALAWVIDFVLNTEDHEA